MTSVLMVLSAARFWTFEDVGVEYSKALLPFRPHIVVDGALYTGQNPQSSHDLAERLLRDLG